MDNAHNKAMLERLLPFGMPATRHWLIKRGLTLHFLDNNLKSKKILSISPGVYYRNGISISWEGVVASLQIMSEKAVHMGGISALELSGFSHYLTSPEKQQIHLYSENKLPSWLNKIPAKFNFYGHGTKRLWLPHIMKDSKLLREYEWRKEGPYFYASTPEKAFLEMLMEVPLKISFEHAENLLQGMTNLSPGRLNILLAGCCHVKVKRLFLWLAKRQNYPWYRKLTLDKVDLGRGKRVIAPNGKLDTEFLITVPRDVHE